MVLLVIDFFKEIINFKNNNLSMSSGKQYIIGEIVEDKAKMVSWGHIVGDLEYQEGIYI